MASATRPNWGKRLEDNKHRMQRLCLSAGRRVEPGVALLFVHARSERAKQFYLGCVFNESTLNAMTLMVRGTPRRGAPTVTP